MSEPSLSSVGWMAAVPAPVLFLDGGGLIRAINPEGAALLARPPVLLVGTPLERWVVPADRPGVERALASRDATSVELEFRLRSARGSVHACRVRCTKRPGGGWALVAAEAGPDAVGPDDDAARLRFLRSLPRHFFLELSPEGTIESAHGLDRTHLTPSEAALGTGYGALTPGAPEDLAVVGDLLACVAEGRSWRGVQRQLRRDGLTFLARIYAVPRKAPSRPGSVGVMLSGVDVDRVHRESRRADEAERLAAAGLLAGRLADRLPAASRPDAGPLALVTEAMLGAQGQPPERAGPIRVPALLTGRPGDGPDGVDVFWTDGSDPEALPLVSGPARPLRRALRCLLAGLERDLPGAGALRGAARTTERSVTLSFIRDGVRLEDEAAEALLQPSLALGTGYVAAARVLAGMRGGWVWALNPTGNGATVFSMDLPRWGRAREGAVVGEQVGAEQGVRSVGGSARVLVVDDEEAVRSGLSRFLTRAGYEVLEAWSGRSAMAQITGGRRPDAMVTDLRMLDGSGFWLLDQLQRYFPELLRATIIITGDEARGRRLSAATGCPLVLKPLELSALVDQLDRLAT